MEHVIIPDVKTKIVWWILEVLSKVGAGKDTVPIEMGSMKMNMEMKGSQQGSVEINEASGRVIRSKTDMQLSGQIKVPANELTPQGMAIPMLIDGTVTVEPMDELEKSVLE